MDSNYYKEEDEDSSDRPIDNGQVQLIATQTAAAIAASIAVMGSLANLGAMANLDLTSLSNLALLASASANGALAGAGGVSQEPEDLSVVGGQQGMVGAGLPLGQSPSPLLNSGSDQGSPLHDAHQASNNATHPILNQINLNGSPTHQLQPTQQQQQQLGPNNNNSLNHNFSQLTNQLSQSLSSLSSLHLNHHHHHHNPLAHHLQLRNNNNNNSSNNNNGNSNPNNNNQTSNTSNSNNQTNGTNNQVASLGQAVGHQRSGARNVHQQQARHNPYHRPHHTHHHHISLSHHSSIQTQQQLLATQGFNPLAVVVGSGQQTEILTPTHLKKAKLMFFYVRYPNSTTLKECFRDVRFQKNNTAQLVKWFSNFREFYYIQMEKFARDAVADERIQCKEDIVVNYDHELINQLNNHYNKNRHIELPEIFRQVAEETLRHFFDAIKNKRDQEQSWKKAIYKLIARLDQEVPEVFKTDAFNEHLE